MTHSNPHAVMFFSLIILLHLITTSFPSVSAHYGTFRDLHTHNLATYHSGQNYKGLSNIKKYFHYLGYISAPPHASNFDDNFDHTLVSAIQTYQNHYGLNVTGKFDRHTLQHMRLPRCGVPDIFNGSTHSAQVANYSFFPGNPRWSSPQVPGTLTYGFVQEGFTISNAFRNAIVNGLNKWGPVCRTSFRQTSQNPNLRIGFYRGNHNDGYPFDGQGGVLAHAFAPTDGRIHFDVDERYVADVSQQPGNNFDLESVAVHEAGHALGLGHSNDRNAIMFPSISPGTRKVNLGQDDINGIRALYGF